MLSVRALLGMEQQLLNRSKVPLQLLTTVGATAQHQHPISCQLQGSLSPWEPQVPDKVGARPTVNLF